jgi:hypothetical protein
VSLSIGASDPLGDISDLDAKWHHPLGVTGQTAALILVTGVSRQFKFCPPLNPLNAVFHQSTIGQPSGP